jgi:hypothetical protein
MIDRVRKIIVVIRDILTDWDLVKTTVAQHKKELDLLFGPNGVGSYPQVDQAALQEKPPRYATINEGRTLAEERDLLRRQ